MSLALRLLQALYSGAAPVARAVLPAPVRARLVGMAERIEATLTPITEQRAIAAARLRDTAPLIAPGEFVGGPIVLVNNALSWGGAERQIVNTLRGLDARTTQTYGLLCQRMGEGGEFTFRLPALRGLRGFARDMQPLASARSALHTSFGAQRMDEISARFDWMPRDVQERIWRLMADFTTLKPEIVHAWQDALGIEAAFAAKLVGTPRILVSGRNVAPVHFGYHRPHMRTAYREIAACEDVIMLNNSEAGANSYAAWLEIDPARIQVLRNGVDFTELERAPASEVAAIRRHLTIPAEAPIIGSIFRFYAEKQPMLWIEAAAAIAAQAPHVHFVLYGEGPLREKALSLAKKRGLADRLHLLSATENVALALSLFDVFLLTSKYEGTPNVVLEASMLGVPVVATPAGGTAEAICEGETGWIENSPETLAQRAVQALYDASFRARCAEAGPRFIAQRFGMARMIQETIALYRLANSS